MNIRRYSLIYIAVVLVLIVLSFLVEMLFSFDITNAGMAFIPAMCAALLEGQQYARRARNMPEPGDMWRFSGQAGLVALVLTMVSTAGLSIILPELRQLMEQHMGTGILIGAVLLQAVLALLVTRWFLGTGAKSELAVQKKATEKDK